MRIHSHALLAFIAVAGAGFIQACTDDVSTSTGSNSTGSGGSGGAGTGGVQTTSGSTSSSKAASSSSSAASSAGGTMCGASDCADVDVLGFITLPGCCPEGSASDKCGLDCTQIRQFLMLPLGCVELDQAGDLDAACPDQTIDAMGQTFVLPGCCRPDMKCGNIVDLSVVAPGVSFGCVDSTPFLDGGMTPSCGGGSGGSGGGGGAGGGADAGP